MTWGDRINVGITTINLPCAIAEAWEGHWAKAVYWTGGVLLTGSILFMR